VTLTREEMIVELLEIRASKRPRFDPLPHQTPPVGDWFFWLLEAGRGAGKTAAAAHYVQEHLNGPPCISQSLPHRVLLVAPTIGDGIESANLNDQALTRIEAGARLVTSGGGSRVIWPNGSQVRVVGTHSREDIERLRASGNTCLIWAEELAAWRYMKEAWDIMLPGLRVGPHPRIVATTTPKPRPVYVDLRATADHISHATTLDNPNINDEMKQRLFAMYGDTSIGKQELYGELIDEAEGALWTYDLIAQGRQDETGGLGRIIVGVDPPGGVTECGIVACGVIPNCKCGAGRMPHFAVLADQSAKLSPEAWATRAVDTLAAFGGDRIVAERNFGGDMVESTIRNVDANVPVKLVTASRGKRLRAEPIKALYEQGRVHHVGELVELESEMVTWIPDESDWSPNRIDALVWALTELSGGWQRPRMAGWVNDPDLRQTRGA